ncbi:MAG TPA: hypothetical protein VFK89_01945 [Actinomycetota bacterium]|nr:hypothetical protein [Actinomycetota bacterium]
MIEVASAVERGAASDDAWIRWRAARLDGAAGELPAIPGQDAEGGFFGPSGRTSPGATALELCRLTVLGQDVSGPAVIAADWLQEVRTPAEAWLDAPDDVPGELDTPAAGRVWATAAAACALLAVDRDPGPRAIVLLRGEADMEGRFTGGAYPTFAAAGAYWLAEGPRTEMAEWALRWTREWDEEWWGPEEFATALTFWAAARIPPDHPSVEAFIDRLQEQVTPDHDVSTLVAAAELGVHFGAL